MVYLGWQDICMTSFKWTCTHDIHMTYTWHTRTYHIYLGCLWCPVIICQKLINCWICWNLNGGCCIDCPSYVVHFPLSMGIRDGKCWSFRKHKLSWPDDKNFTPIQQRPEQKIMLSSRPGYDDMWSTLTAGVFKGVIRPFCYYYYPCRRVKWVWPQSGGFIGSQANKQTCETNPGDSEKPFRGKTTHQH